MVKQMNYQTDSNHPNVNDTPQGTAIFWSESYPDELEILVWNKYSAATGEYQATKARFSIDKESKNLRFEHITIKYPYSTWNDILTNPKIFVSDRMKRALRSFMANDSGSAYWRIIL